MQFLTFKGAKLLFLISLLLMPLLTFMTAVEAAPETIVKVEPESISVNVGEQIIVNITVIDVQNLYGVEVVLYWNSSMLLCVHADVRLGEPDGVLHTPPPIFIAENNTIQNEGKYVLSATAVSPAPPFNGSSTIVRITFNISSPGNSKLDLQSELYDFPPPDRWPPISYPIEHTTIDGSVTVIPEFLQIAILPLLIVVTVFALVLSRKAHRRRWVR